MGVQMVQQQAMVNAELFSRSKEEDSLNAFYN